MTEGVQHHAFLNVYSDGKRILTKNLTPGKTVYGEETVIHGGQEYRVWNPYRSKLAALIRKGLRTFAFESSSKILYLGAATGTTASHISDIAVAGRLFCIEISPWTARKLVRLCEERYNMVPVIADARKPETYSRHVGKVDIIYQDIAQRDQLSIFLKNLKFLKRNGTTYLIIKSRSIDVSAEPDEIYANVKKELEGSGLKILESITLEPYQLDHAGFIIKK